MRVKQKCLFLEIWNLARGLVANLHDKTEYVINIRNLKQALNGSVLKKVHRLIKFEPNA